MRVFLIVEIQISKFRVWWNASWRHEMPKPVRCPEVDVKIPARSACAHGSATTHTSVRTRYTKFPEKPHFKMKIHVKIIKKIDQIIPIVPSAACFE